MTKVIAIHGQVIKIWPCSSQCAFMIRGMFSTPSTCLSLLLVLLSPCASQPLLSFAIFLCLLLIKQARPGLLQGSSWPENACSLVPIVWGFFVKFWSLLNPCEDTCYFDRSVHYLENGMRDLAKMVWCGKQLCAKPGWRQWKSAGVAKCRTRVARLGFPVEGYLYHKV